MPLVVENITYFICYVTLHGHVSRKRNKEFTPLKSTSEEKIARYSKICQQKFTIIGTEKRAPGLKLFRKIKSVLSEMKLIMNLKTLNEGKGFAYLLCST